MFPFAALILVSIIADPAPGLAPTHSSPVTVELRNGSRFEGSFLGDDGGVWIIGVPRGELRLPKRTVLRFVHGSQDSEQATALPGVSVAGAKFLTMNLPPPAPMSFRVPGSWTERKLEGRDIALVDPTGSLVLGVTTVSDAHPLWSFTRAIKKDYGRLYPKFFVEREKISAVGMLTSWELEFRYEKKEEEFREIHLMLDLGSTKRIFTFTASAARFDELISRFRSVVATFELAVEAPADCVCGSGLAL